MASIWRRSWRFCTPGARKRAIRKQACQAFEKRSEFAGRGLQLESLEKRYALDAAPLLDPSASPLLNSVVEDVGVPVGAVGTLVSALIDSCCYSSVLLLRCDHHVPCYACPCARISSC